MHPDRIRVDVREAGGDTHDCRPVTRWIEASIRQKLGIFVLAVQPDRSRRPCGRDRARQAPRQIKDARSMHALTRRYLSYENVQQWHDYKWQPESLNHLADDEIGHH